MICIFPKVPNHDVPPMIVFQRALAHGSLDNDKPEILGAKCYRFPATCQVARASDRLRSHPDNRFEGLMS